MSLSFRNLRDVIIQAEGGNVTKSRRVQQGSNQNWEITVVPDGSGDVSLSLASNGSCGEKAAVCSKDDELLSNELSAVVSGP